MPDICRARRYAQAIAGRMAAEGARDWSDSEIERCLAGCVSERKLVPLAKRLRDSTFASDFSELMAAWDKVMAAAKTSFPEASGEELYHITARVMHHALKLEKEPTHAN